MSGICKECGLPIKVCNAFAYYNKALAYLEKERAGMALSMLRDGNHWYQEWMSEYRTHGQQDDKR